MKQIKTAEQDREEVAQILRDNITFSPQCNDYIIHGAIDKLLEWRRAYAEQFIDAAAEEARLINSEGETMLLCEYEIDKQSILKLKEQLK